MPTRRRVLSLVVAGAVALATPVLLGGCGQIPNPIEGIVEQFAGDQVDLGGDSVPEDFPSEVPLIDGDVVFGGSFGSGDATVWNVTIRSAEPGLPATIAAQLEDAGFEAGIEATLSGDTGTLTYGSEAYGVVVLVIAEGDGFVVNYSVSQNAPPAE